MPGMTHRLARAASVRRRGGDCKSHGPEGARQYEQQQNSGCPAIHIYERRLLTKRQTTVRIGYTRRRCNFLLGRMTLREPEIFRRRNLFPKHPAATVGKENNEVHINKD